MGGGTSAMTGRLVLAAFLCVCLGAQTPAPPPAASAAEPASAAQQPPFRVQVDEVIVPVTVTDDKGRFVSNLDAKDFKIFDEGKEQSIRYFSRERSQPVV